jgi:hypothetical protein
MPIRERAPAYACENRIGASPIANPDAGSSPS